MANSQPLSASRHVVALLLLSFAPHLGTAIAQSPTPPGAGPPALEGASGPVT